MSGRSLEEECGVFGVLDTSGQLTDAARMAYFGLFALQHRGQVSAGIAVNHDGRIVCHKDQGLVVEVFDTTGGTRRSSNSQFDSGIPVYSMDGVKFQGGTGSLEARGVWVGSWNFVARRGRGI